MGRAFWKIFILFLLVYFLPVLRAFSLDLFAGHKDQKGKEAGQKSCGAIILNQNAKLAFKTNRAAKFSRPICL